MGITKAFAYKVAHMLKRFEAAEENEDDIEMMMAIDSRDLTAAANWVKMNEVTCAVPETMEDNELKRTLDAIKRKQQGKVISLTDSKVRVG